MNVVEIIGGEEDRRIMQALRRSIGSRLPVGWLEQRRWSLPQQEPALLVADLAHPCGVDGAKPLILLKERLDDFQTLRLPSCLGIVVASDNLAALQFLAESRLPAITCGLSPHDTLTLTIITEETAVAALQRSLPCWDGTSADPMELPVEMSAPVDRYSLLCCAAVLGVSGLLPQLRQLRL